MATQLPISSSQLNSPDHSKLHRVIASDSAATDEQFVIDGDDAIQVKQIDTPGTVPASGSNQLYFKSDDKIYKRNNSGTEEEVGAGDVTKVGTPLDNQIGIWTGDGTIEGIPGLSYTPGANPLLEVSGYLRFSDHANLGIIFKNTESSQQSNLTWQDSIGSSVARITTDYTNEYIDLRGYSPSLNIVLRADFGENRVAIGGGNTYPGALLDLGEEGVRQGEIRFAGSTSGYTDITPSVTAGNNTLTLPTTTGTVALTSDITGTNSGTNTGDNATNTQYSSLVTNATHTGDATGDTALTVVKINGTLMSGLATGILKNTTTTGVPSIAVAGDFPTLNQNTTGNAGTVSTITGLAPDTATTQATQPNITSLGTLTTLTVDNINLNGSTISATGDAGLALYDNASNGIFIEDGGNVGIGTTAPAYELDVDGFTNTKSIHEVSDEGLVLGMNFNTENNVGTAGSETVLDSSTYNNHGTNNGATHDPDGGFNGGGAFSFDGTNDYIDLGTNLIDWSNNWTISLWINPTGTGDAGQDVFESLDGNNGVRIQYDDITNGRIECFVGNGATTIRPSSTDITPNEWTEVVLNYDGTNSKLYMNGELKDTDAVVATNQTGVTQLGRFFTGTAEHYSGLIDNVKIYNRALSADEIKAQYLQRAEVGDSFVSQSDVFVDSSGNVGIGTVAPTSKLHTIQTETTGNALLVSRDLAAASTNSPLVSLVQDNAGDDQNALSIQNDGTGYGIYVDQNGNNRSIYVDSGATTAPVFTLNAANTDGNVVAWTFAGNHADSGNINFLFDNTNINSVVRNILIRQQGVGINTTFQNTLALAGEVVQVIQDNASSTADAQSIQNNGTGTCLLLSQTQDVEVIDFDACTDGGTSKTTIAGSLKIQMPNGSTGYINFYT